MDTSGLKIPRLQGSNNWDIWSIRMEAVLTSKGFIDVMTPAPEEPLGDPIRHAERAERSLKACSLIRLGLNDGPLLQTRHITDSMILWNTLKALYEPKGFSSEFLTCKEFFNQTLARNGGSMERYLTQIKRLTDDLSARNLGIPNKVIAAYTLNNLTPEYDHTVAVISQAFRQAPGDDIDLIALFGQLVDESRRLKSKEPNEMALLNRSTGQLSENCSFCHKRGHNEQKCYQKHPELRVKGKRPSNPKAPKKGPKNDENKAQEAEYTLTAFPQNDQLELGPPTGQRAISPTGQRAVSPTSLGPSIALASALTKDTWILDSGATTHITANRDLFTEIRPYTTSLKWGEAKTIPVKGIGAIRVKFASTGKIGTIQDCLYVPELGVNLLSVGKLITKGILPSFTKQGCQLRLNQKVIAKGTYKNGLTLIETSPFNEQVMLTVKGITESPKTWHERLGHPGKPALEALPKATLGCTFNEEPYPEGCEICIQAKATVKVSKKPSTEAKAYLDLVYSDICGPISPETFNGARYFVTLIDKFTRYTEVFLLKNRGELYPYFEEWLTRTENQENANRSPSPEANRSITRLKRFHSDNAKEYLDHRFQSLFTVKGIMATYPAPYAHEQNGGAEIFNRTIMAKVRAMLIASGLPKAYWGEALTGAVYLYNRTPHTALGGKTPYEAKNGKKPDISNIRIWGSLAYKRNPLVKKLDPKAIPHILTGWGPNQYRLVHPQTYQVSWARDTYILEGKYKSTVKEDRALAQILNRTIADQNLNKQLAVLGNQPVNKVSDQLVNESPNQPDNESTDQLVNELTDQPVDEPNYSWLDQLVEAAAYNTSLTGPEPITYKEAKNSPDWPQWKQAMEKEIGDLNEQGTWTLVPRPPNTKVLRGKWVYKLKEGPKYKARWVAKGFLQRSGLDFNETFAHTVNPVAYRLLLTIGALEDWEIHQWDVKSAYPNASIKETIYMEQPIGFETSPTGQPGPGTLVCRLNKALYGLKQSAREWQIFWGNTLKNYGLVQLKSDTSVYVLPEPLTIIIVYVDDMLVISPSVKHIARLYEQLNQEVSLTNLGPASTFLGIEIRRERPKRSMALTQKAYTGKILERFTKTTLKGSPNPSQLGVRLEPNPEKALPKEIEEYQQEIGSLMYLMTKTRPDLAYSVGLGARFMSNPGPEHTKALNRIWAYLVKNPDLGLFIQPESGPPTGQPDIPPTGQRNQKYQIRAYCDSDWGGDFGTRRSTTGLIIKIGSTPIAWNSKLQRTVALSSCEAEYMALKDLVKELLFIQNLILELRDLNIGVFNQIEVQNAYTDSSSAISLAKNPVFHHRTKHIDIQYHFVREAYKEGLVKLNYIPTEEQIADILTKAVDNSKWLKHLAQIVKTYN